MVLIRNDESEREVENIKKLFNRLEIDIFPQTTSAQENIDIAGK